MSLLNGVAFTSLTTSSEEAFQSAFSFYKSLGFKVVRSYNHDIYATTFLKGVSSDSLKEAWLESFKLSLFKDGQRVPIQESNSCQTEGAFIKLRLTSSDHASFSHQQAIKFFCMDLGKVSEVLQLPIENNQISTLDPLGVSLQFVDIPTPSHEPITEEYFERHAVDSQLSSLPESSAISLATGQKKKKIAVMTSGGDSQGMNAAVRAVVRAGIFHGCDVFAIYEGYSGLVKGGDLIKQMQWQDVRGWLALGGTLIGTARCMEFREKWGRLQAAKNMVLNGIDALVVCGGDGSLTGADLFRSEWPSLLDELVSKGELTNEQVEPHRFLTIVGLVGSIDNDMAGTDSTIGANSSLERIREMVDYIDATATSHSRAFVVEVMGRHCGWLALNAGIATGADYIFIPERAANPLTWKDDLKEVCARHRAKGKRNTTVIVAEGALDADLKPITSEDVKAVLVELGLDTRITLLGHVQRGGVAVASDRLLATLQGVEAVKAVLDLTPADPSPLIGVLENKIIRTPLVEAVENTKQVATAIAAKDFDKAISLRNTDFIESYQNYISISQHEDGSNVLPENKQLNIAIVHVGASSAALNPATRAFVLYALSKGHKPFAIENGFSGLIRHGSVRELKWEDVESWHGLGGSEIGTNRSLPSLDLGTVAFYFQKYKLDGLIIAGGFEGFTALHELTNARDQFPAFNIPLTLIPATVSNNVPGTEYSLGSDTCLNSLVDYCDAVKQSASATRRRVFVVEVQGGHSGYVASMIGLVTGAVAVYTPEDKVNLKTIQEDIDLLKENYKQDQGENRSGKMLIRNEQASSIFSTELIADIIQESSNQKFETRTAIPGHVQQGGQPTAVDRVNASRFAIKCTKFIEEYNFKINDAHLEGATRELRFTYKHGKKVSTVPNNDNSAAVLGVKGSELKFTPINELWQNETNVTLRKGTHIHWESIIAIGDVLSGRLLLRNQKGL